MVTIEAHRNAIVSYYDKARLSSSSRHGKSNSLSSHKVVKNAVIKIKVLLSFLAIYHLR